MNELLADDLQECEDYRTLFGPMYDESILDFNEGQSLHLLKLANKYIFCQYQELFILCYVKFGINSLNDLEEYPYFNETLSEVNTSVNNFIYACEKGYLLVAKWLYSL